MWPYSTKLSLAEIRREDAEFRAESSWTKPWPYPSTRYGQTCWNCLFCDGWRGEAHCVHQGICDEEAGGESVAPDLDGCPCDQWQPDRSFELHSATDGWYLAKLIMPRESTTLTMTSTLQPSPGEARADIRRMLSPGYFNVGIQPQCGGPQAAYLLELNT